MNPSSMIHQRQFRAANLCINCVCLFFLTQLVPFNRGVQAFNPILQLLINPSYKTINSKPCERRSTATTKTPSLLIVSSRSTTSVPFVSVDSTAIAVQDDDDNEADDTTFLDSSWGQTQEWAIQDSLSKYTVTIPNMGCFAMWRSMIRDTVELAGYDVHFIRKMIHQRQPSSLSTNNGADTNSEVSSSPGVLPLLDEFEFRPNGGVAGRIRGLRGISDGTIVESSPLAQVDVTVPRGYVVTEDGSTAYELGVPGDGGSEFGMMDTIGSSSVGGVVDATKSMRDGVDGTTRTVVQAVLGGVGGGDDGTAMLANLGTTTAIVLGGVMAFNLLSHHLTINVFWV